jgi:predicted dehydrogenase
MTGWPAVDYGHTSFGAAMVRGDVYDVRPNAQRAAKKPLRIAIAGCGGVAQAKWLPAIRRLQTIGEPIVISGLVEPDSQARAKVEALAGARGHSNLRELFDAGRPELLLILASDVAHVSLATQAIEASVACLVEKPLSTSAAEAARLVTFARQKGVLLAAVANKRYSPPYATAKSLIESNALKSPPTIFSGKFTLGYPYVDLLRGGTVHLIDLALWFMGPIDKLNARAMNNPAGLESAIISMRFCSGAIGSLMTSAAGLSFKPWERLEIFGRNAFLVVDDQHDLTLYDNEVGPAKTWRPAVPNTLMFDESFGGYTGLLENVLDALRGLVPLAIPATEGAAAIEVIDAIERSIRDDIEIDLGKEGFAP